MLARQSGWPAWPIMVPQWLLAHCPLPFRPPRQLCTLKHRPVGGNGRPSLASYGAGPRVPWTSGYLVRGGAGAAGPSSPPASSSGAPATQPPVLASSVATASTPALLPGFPPFPALPSAQDLAQQVQQEVQQAQQQVAAAGAGAAAGASVALLP